MSSEFVPNQILTAADLNSSFDGKTDNASAAITGGFATGLDAITVTGATASISPTTGALVVTGGVGIGLSLNIGAGLNVGGQARVSNTTNSTSPSTGAFVVVGGVGVGANVQVGGALAVVGSVTGARIVSTDVTQATSPSTGALVVPGGVGVGKDAWIGGDLHVQGALTAQGGTTLQGPLSVASLTLSPGGAITFGDGTTQNTKPMDDAASDGNKYGRKNAAWTVLTDLPDAPSDGKKYGRSNAAWIALTDTPDAPNDTFYYGRHAAAWAKVTPEAPLDAFIYGRANGAWAKSVPEAPVDGKQYVRLNAAWSQVSASGMVVSDTPPTDTARFPQWWDTRSASLFVWYDDGTSAQWVIALPVPETSGGGGGGGIPDAPSDGQTYGRNNAAWVVVPSGGGGGGLPTDGSGAMTGQLKVINGTAAAPGISFSAAPTNGLSNATGGVNVVVGGVAAYTFGSTQATFQNRVVAPNGTTLNPSFSFPGGGGLYAKSASVAAMSAAGLDAMTWDYNAGAPKTTVGGLLSLGATGQIQFPATVNYSTDPNTLDDYEEGSWTPSIAIGGLVVNSAQYTKIGRTVNVMAFVTFPASSDPGNVVINGLPFHAAYPGPLSVGYQNTAIATQVTAMAMGNGINVYGGAGFATFAQFTGGQIYIGGTYTSAPPESGVIASMNNTGATTFTGPGGITPPEFWNGRAGTNVTISNVQGSAAAASAMNGQVVPVTITNGGTRFNLGITTTGIDLTGVTATLTSPP